MIHVYTISQDSENWIMQNDWYFNLYTSNGQFTEEDKAVIRKIDHAELTCDKHIQSKYGLGTVRNLSTGCKTMLNVIKNPHKVVNANECGPDVLNMIFSMDGISLYMTRPESINIRDDMEICFNDADIVTGRRGYEHWWTEEYRRRDMDGL